MKVTIEVSVSPEDVRLMQEIAEMKDVQSFVSLSPTVCIKAGSEQRDVKEIVENIKERLRQEIKDSTNVVFGDQQSGSPVVGTVKIDGTRIADAFNKASDIFEQMMK